MAYIRIFAHNGWIVHRPNPEADYEYSKRGVHENPLASGFQRRRPIVADERQRKVYVGEPYWTHDDVLDHHGLDAWSAPHYGWFEGGSEWGNGGLQWYGREAPEFHGDVAHALLESGFEIPNPEGENAAHGEDLDLDDVPDDLWDQIG